MAGSSSQGTNEQKILYQTAVEHSPDGIFALTEELKLVLVNSRIESLVGVEREELVGSHASVFCEMGIVDEENYDRAIAACRTVLAGDVDSAQFEVQLTPESGPVTADYRVERVSREEGNAVLVGALRDISTQIDQRKQIKRQRNELNTVSRIQSVLHDIMQSLSSSTTRAEINKVVCDNLIQSEFYDAAWIGYRGARDGGLTDVYTAGVEPDIRELITARDRDWDEGSVLSDAFDTGRIQVINNPATDSRLPGLLRDRLVENRYNSAIVVPLTTDTVSIGALTITTHRENAFIGRERLAFEALGSIVEFALSAVENVQLLQGAKTIELRFRIQTGSIAADISETFDCECYLDGIPSSRNDDLRCFFSVEDVSPADVATFVEQRSAVRSFEVIDEWETGATFEMVLQGSPLQPVVESGIHIEGASASDGTAYMTVQIGADRNPSEVRNTVESIYPEIELVGKRSVENSYRSVADLRGWMDEHLTTKQRQALEEAYFRGYFEWPRDNTAEEIADVLDISSSTFHAHHRKATRKLLAEMFEKGTDR